MCRLLQIYKSCNISAKFINFLNASNVENLQNLWGNLQNLFKHACKINHTHKKTKDHVMVRSDGRQRIQINGVVYVLCFPLCLQLIMSLCCFFSLFCWSRHDAPTYYTAMHKSMHTHIYTCTPLCICMPLWRIN